MPTLLLTTYERCRRYISDQDGTPLTSSAGLKREIINWIQVASRQIEEYLGRKLHREWRTEYLDAKYGVDLLHPTAIPIIRISALDEDNSGLWDGTSYSSLTESDDYNKDKNDESLQLLVPSDYGRTRAFRMHYEGGVAWEAAKAELTVVFPTSFGTLNYVIGSESEAMGIVRARDSASLSLEVLRGAFVTSEGLTEYSDEDETTATGVTDAVSAITREPLISTNPDIVRACEIMVRHYYKRKHDFDVTGTNKENVTFFDRGTRAAYALTKEARDLLAPYRRYRI